MKIVYNISPNIKKILIMFLLVIFLAACGSNTEDYAPGEICTSEEDVKGGSCIDAKDVACLGCSIFTLLFNAVSVNVMKLHGQLTSGAMSLMMVCFSIWLVVRLLKFVTSLAESSISQVWNEILKQGFLCVFCGILASSPEMLIYAVNTFVYPIYAAFLKLGIAIMETSVTNSEGTATTFMVYGETVRLGNVNLVCTFDKVGLVTKDGFPKEFLNAIVCMIKAVKQYLSIGGDISVSLMSQGESIMGWLSGALLFVFFFIVRIGIVFYLVDNIFQMGIIILLLPIFIIAYPFNMTRNWLLSSFQNLLSSAGFLMCFSVIVAMVLRAMVELIVKNPSLFSPENPEYDMANVGLGCLCLLLIGALIYGSVSVAEGITGSLIGAHVDKKFQENLTKIVDKVKGWGLKGAAALVTFSTALLPASVQEYIKKVQEAKAKVNRLAGRTK